MAMFRAASLKLGLDYAIMHNMRNPNSAMENESLTVTTNAKNTKGRKNKNDESEDMAGISNVRADNYSALSRKELENLLKYGAYDIFRDEKDGQTNDESLKFCNENIEDILKNSAVVMHNTDENNEMSTKTISSGFSKASFVSSNGKDDNIDIDDPDFWNKVVGLTMNEDNEEYLAQINKQRKCRDIITNYKEPDMKSLNKRCRLNNNNDSDDSDDEYGRNNSNNDDDEQMEINTINLNKLLTAIVSKGYGNWSTIRTDSKLYWSISNIAKISRRLVLQLLITSSLSNNILLNIWKDNLEDFDHKNYIWGYEDVTYI